MTIADILNKDERERVVRLIKQGASYSYIKSQFPGMNRMEVAVFKDFINHFRYHEPLKTTFSARVSLGSRQEPYYDNEDDMKMPEYDYESLSASEKIIWQKKITTGTPGNTSLKKNSKP